MALNPWRVQIILPYLTNIPQDVSTNTIYILADEDPDFVALTSSISVLYNYVADGAGHGPSWYLSELISREEDGCHMRFFNMLDPEPRPLRAETDWGLTETGTGAGLPPEVALCSSFKAAGASTPRTRGRIYYGPFNERALSESGVGSPSQGLIDALAAAADFFQGEGGEAEDYQWMIYSPTGGLYHIVNDGWVDNAFDTQRRRGVQADQRKIWV